MTQLNEQEMKLVELISEGCRTPKDVTSKLKQLFAGTLEKMLEAEMDEHLGYEKNSILYLPSAPTFPDRLQRTQCRIGRAAIDSAQSGKRCCAG